MREGDRTLIRAAAGALATSALAAGCGFGEGETADGAASLTITRDYGAQTLAEGTLSGVSESDTVIRFLDSEAEITTRFGDNFVQSIDGLAGRVEEGARFDWFFYVNGYWSPLGAGEAAVHVGDRIWWDYREWNAAYRVPAVVGSFPEPFVHGYDGEPLDVELVCEIESDDACEWVEERLRAAGANPLPGNLDRGSADALRVLVGPYRRLAADEAAGLLGQGPEISGVFVEVEGDSILPLSIDGGPAGPPLDGLIAATRFGDDEPTWLITGSGRAGVESAAGLLDEGHLANRFALGVRDDEPAALPSDGVDE